MVGVSSMFFIISGSLRRLVLCVAKFALTWFSTSSQIKVKNFSVHVRVCCGVRVFIVCIVVFSSLGLCVRARMGVVVLGVLRWLIGWLCWGLKKVFLFVRLVVIGLCMWRLCMVGILVNCLIWLRTWLSVCVGV